ncbi:RNA polymerase beta'' subunit [Leptotrichia hongkongensis]|uniref:RNA polymerase beta'' subunit n=1 Tax=Leptotrichia hongkongensis TaxID=554406 RepID=A0A510L694_9FUSO|nr:RNA polymerase beta'' subunit [Leptotrichia hongkongensis]
MYIAELNEAKEIRVSYSYEELFYSFYLYYLKNMADYSDFMLFIEQELYNYIQYTDNLKKYKIKFDLNDFFNRDKLRNFLIEYNKKENIYNYNFINFNRKYINYWDINILKNFIHFY